MVACAALSSIQPPNHLAVPMTASAQIVEELKQRLLSAAENDKEAQCDSLLEELRKAVTSREILEHTRVGFHVNNVRRNYLKRWPNLSKKCRDLIKSWQDFVSNEKGRPHSGASSSNTTPNVLSPSMAKLARRGITPNTPVNRRVTSTGLQIGRLSATVSPASGSYAPRSQISPGVTACATNGIHKSQSVGGDLINHNGRPMTPKKDLKNGKRKAVDDPGAAASIKRTKTVTGSLSSPLSSQSVSAARKAVQSTSELVAQLSQNLPQHMHIDSSIRKHEEKLKREHKDEEFAIQLQTTSSQPIPEKKKRKYEKKQKKNAEKMDNHFPVVTGVGERSSGSLILKLGKSRQSFATAEMGSASTSSFEKIRSIPKETTPPPVPEEEDEGVDEVDGKANTASTSTRKDWSSLIPSMAELKLRAEKEEQETKKLINELSNQTKKDPTKVQKIKNFRRPILMLPYLDNPLGPDFLVHKYRNSAQYYSDANFLYGEQRPPV